MQNGWRLVELAPVADGALLRLLFDTPEGRLARFARSVVMATGTSGAGGHAVPEVIARAVPLARGVRVRIGSDGPGSNDTQDMQEAAKFALLLPRAGRPDAEWPRPAQVLAMATAGRALTPGAGADLIAFDLRAAAFADARPAEIVARLLLAARPRDLRHVLRDGEFLMRDGALLPPALRLDALPTRAQCQDGLARLARRLGRTPAGAAGHFARGGGDATPLALPELLEALLAVVLPARPAG